MAKEYVTARDIEELAIRGIREIPASDDLIFTDLARDRAATLGVLIVRPGERGSMRDSPEPYRSTASSMAKLASIANIGLKPSGCLHSHIPQEPSSVQAVSSQPAELTPKSGSLVERLVEAVRQLGR